MSAGDPDDRTGPLRRAPHVLSAPVGDGLLLVDTRLVQAHGLNSSAAAVWQALDQPASPRDVTARIATALGVGDDVVAFDVGTALDLFVAKGVVSATPGAGPDGADVDPGGATSFANVPATDEPVPATAGALEPSTRIGPYRGLDVTFELVTTDPDLGEHLAAIWSPLATGSDAPGRRYRYLVVGHHPDPDLEHLLALDGHVVARAPSASALVALVVWHANQLVSTQTARLLQLHAAALDIGGAGLVLPAAMNSGKSTLATALVAAGAGYLTDEAAAIDPSTLAIEPYPKAITLDPGSWALFPDLDPGSGRDHPRFGHRKWYVDPRAVAGADRWRPSTPVPVATIVFPTYAAGATTTIEPVAPVAAAAELARNAFNLVAVGQPGVDTIARLATSSRCWRQTSGDLADAVAAIRRVATPR